MQIILKDADGIGYGRELPLETAPEYLSFTTGNGDQVFFAEVEPRVYVFSHLTDDFRNERQKD